jgi:hypothetical protein
MNPEQLLRQIETYSNAIVAFAVVQSLAFGYQFGTNELFNCLVRLGPHLQATLSVLFVIVTMLSLYALRFLGSVARGLAEGYGDIVRKMFFGKMIIVLVFNALPLFLVVKYAQPPNPTVDCHAGAKKPAS